MSRGAELVSVLGLLLSVACGSARRGQPFDEPLELNAEQLQGRQVFMRHCHQCHPGGEGGLGPALNNKLLPGPAIRLQVRSGLGDMPSFGPDKISPSELDALSAYVLELQSPRRTEP